MMTSFLVLPADLDFHAIKTGSNLACSVNVLPLSPYMTQTITNNYYYIMLPVAG